MFPREFNLTSLNGNNGFTLQGSGDDDNDGGTGGVFVNGAGDMNGDGISDVIIAAPCPGNCTMQSYVVFGNRTNFPALFDLAYLNGANGFTLNSPIPYGLMDPPQGISSSLVSYAGDVNHDGYGDILIGSWQSNGPQEETSYVVFGDNSRFPALLNLSDLNGKNGFAINNHAVNNDSPYSVTGSSVSNAGDINDDGVDDIIVGSLSANQSYVIFGNKNGFSSVFDTSELNGLNGFVLNVGGNFGTVGWAGDINNDGISDIIVVGSSNSGDVGTYVVFGSKMGFPKLFDIAGLNGENGFTFSVAGCSVSFAGDVNADGVSDIIVGAELFDLIAGGSNAKNYVIFGSRNAFSAVINPNDLNGINGFSFTVNNTAYCTSVSGAGDVNLDGIDDIIIGNGRSEEQSYIVFGSKNPFPALINSTWINGINGLILNGNNDSSIGANGGGISVGSAGDFNGDGINDVIIGSIFFEEGSYIMYGQKYFDNDLVGDV